MAGALLEALRHGNVERFTFLGTGDEALFQGGKMIYATDSGLDYSKADLHETVKAPPHLVLFGAGHVGKALYDIAALQDMAVTVLDDRKELLTAERFPKAERICAAFEELLSREYGIISPYFIIFTHGHAADNECLRYALRHPSPYIGMIGSKAKSQRALEMMRAEGFEEERIKAVHTPIGLSIGAETPEEIAISIMAEIISVFRKEANAVIADIDLLRLEAEKGGISVRIVSKAGSAPRAIGTEMLVTEECTAGTIGGGAIELEAIKEARRMLKDGRRYLLCHHDLSPDGDIGMVCGGNETLLFRAI